MKTLLTKLQGIEENGFNIFESENKNEILIINKDGARPKQRVFYDSENNTYAFNTESKLNVWNHEANQNLDTLLDNLLPYLY